MEECCQRKLDAGLDEILQDLDLDDDILRSPEQPDGSSEDRFGDSRLDRARRFVWVLLEYPQSSLAAKVRARAAPYRLPIDHVHGLFIQ